jgi:hypothetical protein
VEEQHKIFKIKINYIHMAFEDSIRKWAALGSKISDINTSVKELRNERNNLETSIIRHVEDNSLNGATIKLSDSKLKFINNKITPPLTFKFIKSCLDDIIEDTNEVDEIINYIKDRRESKTSLGIKRFFNN